MYKQCPWIALLWRDCFCLSSSSNHDFECQPWQLCIFKSSECFTQFLSAIFHTMFVLNDRPHFLIASVQFTKTENYGTARSLLMDGALKSSPSKLVARAMRIEWQVSKKIVAIGIDMGTNLLQNILEVLCTASMCNSSCQRLAVEEGREATTDLYL